MKKRTNGRGAPLPLKYTATLTPDNAEIVVRLARAQTRQHFHTGDASEAKEYRKNPVQPVDVLDEALNLGLHFQRLRDLGDDGGDRDFTVTSKRSLKR